MVVIVASKSTGFDHVMGSVGSWRSPLSVIQCRPSLSVVSDGVGLDVG